MAKPKGSTLSALFEVSEQERQAFYERIQRKIHPIDEGTAQLIQEQAKEATAKSGVPETGTPERGIPASYAINSNIYAHEPLPAPLPSALTELNLERAAPLTGTPGRGIPESGTPQRGTPERGIPDTYDTNSNISAHEALPVPPPSALTELNPERAAPLTGTPERGIPESGTPF